MGRGGQGLIVIDATGDDRGRTPAAVESGRVARASATTESDRVAQISTVEPDRIFGDTPSEPPLRPGDRVGLVANSDGLTFQSRAEYTALLGVLEGIGLKIVESPHLFAPTPDSPTPDAPRRHDHAHPASDAERARALEDMFSDQTVKAVFDVSGGDLAGGVLTHLDIEVVAANPKPLFGYSDLTVLVNALHPVTPTYLWNVRNLVRSDAATQRGLFAASVLGTAPDLFDVSTRAIQCELPQSPVVGGNLRCLLKLAGTRHFPELGGRILALESQGATPQDTYSGMHQLRQLGAFDASAGVLLGNFTALQRSAGDDAPVRVLLDVLDGHPARRSLPIARGDFGHHSGSRAIRIGRPLPL